MEFFAELGWHEEPSDIAGDLVNWLAEIVGDGAFPWVASGILGLAVGSWSHHFLTLTDRSTPTKSESLSETADRIEALIDDISRMYKGWEKNGDAGGPAGRWHVTVAGSYMALETDLARLGIKLPKLEEVGDVRNWQGRINSLLLMLSLICERSKYGQLREARKLASQKVLEFKAQFRNA